jgi:hypothetical protein
VPHDHLQVVPRIQINVYVRPQRGTKAANVPSFLIYCGAKLALRQLFACDFGHSVPADSLHKLSPTVREMTMSRIILLVGALALAVAGTTTVAFRTTGAGTSTRPDAADPLGEHLRAMHKEMALP